MLDPEELRKLWDFGDPAASEARFRESRANRDGEDGYELDTQIARALGLQGRLSEARELLSGIEASIETPPARVRWLLEMGRVLNSSGDPAAARPFFESAWDLAQESGLDALAVDAAHMVAIAAPPEERRAWNEAGMRLAESSDDPEAARWVGSLSNNMGWDAHDEGEYAEALRLHERALAWQNRHGNPTGVRIATWSVAKQLRFLGRLEDGLELQGRLLAEYEADEPGGEGFVREELGELLLALGRASEAAPHFAEAHRLLSEVGWVERERLQRLRRLSDAGRTHRDRDAHDALDP